MHKIDSLGHDNNQFVDGDLGQGIVGTKVIAKWLNAIQGELVNVVENAGLTLDDLNNTQLLEAIGLISITTGSIIAMPTSIAPDRYLECDGAEYSRTLYPELFAVIGTTFGIGDGSTTFNIPDLRGRFIRGWDPSGYLGNPNGETEAGRTLGSYQPDIFKSHTHGYFTEIISPGTVWGGDANEYTHGVESSFATGGDETRPRNVALMFCIKY